MKKYLQYFILLIIVSCSKYSSEIEKALDMAGENRKELIKVLEHFKNEKNEEKVKAAESLVANLPYNYSYDTLNLHKYNIT